MRWLGTRIMPIPALIAADPALKAAFDGRFASVVGRRPSAVAAIGYDAVVAVSEMLRAAGSDGGVAFDGAAITRGQGFEGATGSFRLTGDGRNVRSLAILEVGPSGAVVVDPAPRSAPTS
ncbi:MAG: hypothetical protein AAF360_11025 [Pseudomonadota bacterium]